MINKNLKDKIYTPKGSTCICWNGTLSIGGRALYVDQYVDEMIWTQKFGSIPDKFKLYHSCVNNHCINICHLYIKPVYYNSSRDEVEKIRVRGGKTVEVRRIKKGKRKPRNYQCRHIEYITSDDLKKRLYYSEDSLRWLTAEHGTYTGQPVGTVNNLYNIRTMSLDGILYRVEDLVWIYFNGPLHEHERIVPINGDTSDCRIENLHKIEVFPK